MKFIHRKWICLMKISFLQFILIINVNATSPPSSSTTSSSSSLVDHHQSLGSNDGHKGSLIPIENAQFIHLASGSMIRPIAPAFQSQLLQYPVNHQNFYPSPASLRPAAVYAPSIITAIQWNQRQPIYAAMVPIYAQYITEPEPTTQTNIIHNISNKSKSNLFSKRIDIGGQILTKSDPEFISNDKTHSFTCDMGHSGLASENYPVYVLPPKNFQPIIYTQPNNQLTSFFAPIPLVYQQHQSPLQKSNKQPNKAAEELWYESNTDPVPNNKDGLLKQGKYNHNHIDRTSQLDKHKIALVPVTEADFDNLPILEASALVPESHQSISKNVKDTQNQARSYKTYAQAINPYTSQTNSQVVAKNKSRKTKKNKTTTATADVTENGQQQQTRYKTRLPVGLTSFFLGGSRGVSARHWRLPQSLIKQLEFMPNLDLPLKNEYFPDDIDDGSDGTDDDDLLIDQDGSTEKEDSTFNNMNILMKKSSFNPNTIIDSEEDLEAQESSPEPAVQIRPIIINQRQMVNKTKSNRNGKKNNKILKRN